MVSERKKEHVLMFLIGVVLVVIVNQLITKYPVRFDLTEEKRYSISDASKQLLKSLDDVAYVEIYLDGDLPSGFKRLKNAIAETLDDFKFYAGTKIEYKFIDPSIAASQQARNEYYKSIIDKGIVPTNLAFNKDGNKTEKLIFPGAVVSYYGKEKAVMLLKGNQAASAEERLNQSVEGLEYELSNAIRILASDQRKKIGMITGHGEPDSLNIAGLNNALLDKYDVFQVNLPERTTPLNGYDALVIGKPTTAFSEQEKYKLDQYIMGGGKALFFLDALHVNMDSAVNGDGTVALPYELNLTDMLFKYGVRINQNYVQDIVCGNFPVVAGNMGDQPQIRMLPWPFFPVINTFGDHPIVKNMDAISMKFASNMDTVKADGIKKTPLLYTSQYSRMLSFPVRIAMNELQKSLDPKLFNKGEQAVGYLLEGSFSSLYKNRLLPAGVDKGDFIPDGKETAIVVCSDGDMIRNEFSLKTGEPLELGADPFSTTLYANRDFVMNALEYLLNDNGIITAKAKEIKLRPLDKVKVAEEKTKWQLINLAIPLVLLLAYGVVRYYHRKKKYSGF
ncbi:MAG: gliding motility-associated ABC transporter substrate-binding protein GldG [Cyclobacteriaceae bacterium]